MELSRQRDHLPWALHGGAGDIFYATDTKRIIASRNARFFEDEFPQRSTIANLPSSTCSWGWGELTATLQQREGRLACRNARAHDDTEPARPAMEAAIINLPDHSMAIPKGKGTIRDLVRYPHATRPKCSSTSSAEHRPPPFLIIVLDVDATVCDV
eukprot:TRINITY_DN3335_c0_g2_i2.p1 TRINITY_DN3335_c0_g2~~TRINITY_DN3335_c0_g2_i2.p1  ORF type:complete len:156 (-),score=10.49 TRINITY_DN3335_c0_g2_i2:638-1105(-)